MDADFGIIKVHWDYDHSRIIEYMAWPYDKSTNKLVSPTRNLSVDQIIGMINSVWDKKVFYTLPVKNGNYTWGAHVVPGQYLGVPYLTTDPNNRAEDNLESLPEY